MIDGTAIIENKLWLMNFLEIENQNKSKSEIDWDYFHREKNITNCFLIKINEYVWVYEKKKDLFIAHQPFGFYFYYFYIYLNLRGVTPQEAKPKQKSKDLDQF